MKNAFLAAGIVAAVATAGIAARSAETTILRYGIDDPTNVNRLSQIIADREGLFAREGLKVDIVRFTSSFRNRDQAAAAGASPATVRQAMAQGTIDMSREQLPLLINDDLAGGKNIGVAIVSNDPVYFLAVRPEIKTFADLKGKTITITNPHDGITIWTRELLALHGLKTGDVTLKNIAGSDGRFKCLNSGECAGATLDQPAIFKALDAGHHVLGMTNEDHQLLYQVDVVTPAWAGSHRDAVGKYIRATTAAAHFIMDPKNHDEVVKVMTDFTGQPEPRVREILTYIWDPKNRVLPQSTAPDINAVRDDIALLGKYDVLKQPLPPAERFVDPSYGLAANH
jgi:ABC-type nitrate/sulfonate/bicarbonate transport system substrate-binding protein